MVAPLVVGSNKMSSHGHGGGSCGHSHSHDDISDAERGNQFSLYLKIDLERLQCLNESEDGSGKNVFKPWDKRLDVDKVDILILSPKFGSIFAPCISALHIVMLCDTQS